MTSKLHVFVATSTLLTYPFSSKVAAWSPYIHDISCSVPTFSHLINLRISTTYM